MNAIKVHKFVGHPNNLMNSLTTVMSLNRIPPGTPSTKLSLFRQIKLTLSKEERMDGVSFHSKLIQLGKHMRVVAKHG